MMDYLVGQLSTADRHVGALTRQIGRLDADLDAEEKHHDRSRESFSAFQVEYHRRVDSATLDLLLLTRKYEDVCADNERLQETNHGLETEISRLTARLAAIDTVRASTVSEAEASTGAAVSAASTSSPSDCSVGSAVSPAEGTSSSFEATAAKGTSASSFLAATSPRRRTEVARSSTSTSLLAVTPSRLRLDVACLNEQFAVASSVDSVSPARFDGVQPGKGVFVLGASTAAVSGGFSGPAVSSAKGPSFSSATTSAKGKGKEAYYVPAAMTPSRPRVEVAHISEPFTFSLPVENEASSPPIVTTSSRSRRQAPAKTRKPAGGEENLLERSFFDLNSALAEEERNAVNGKPRQCARPPLTPIMLNSWGKRAAAGKKPLFAVRAATDAYLKGSPTGKEVSSVAPRVEAKKPALKPYLRRSSVGFGMPSLAARAVAGGEEQNGSVGGKGPFVKGGRGGTRKNGIFKAKGSGDGGGKVGVASSGRVPRVASRAAAVGAGKEEGISAASGKAPDDAASAAQSARANRTTTRR